MAVLLGFSWLDYQRACSLSPWSSRSQFFELLGEPRSPFTDAIFTIVDDREHTHIEVSGPQGVVGWGILLLPPWLSSDADRRDSSHACRVTSVPFCCSC